MLLMLVVLVPAFGLLAWVEVLERESALDEVKSKVLYVARIAAAEESQIIQSTRQLLQQFAQTPEARGETSRAVCNDLVARQTKLSPNYYNLGVIAPNGMRRCSASQPGQVLDLSDRSYFRRAVETREFSVGDYQIGRTTGKADVSFGFPMIDANGALLGVAYTTLNLEWFAKSLAHAQLPQDCSLSVIDSQGNTLARFPDTEEQFGRPITRTALKEILAHGGTSAFESTGADGIQRVWGFVPLRQSASGDLWVSVGMPIAAAHVKINQAFQRNLLLIGATTLLILGVGWVGGERLVIRPVKRLTEAARLLSKRDLSARTGLPHGEGEFGQLARVFDDMADSIQSEDATLERLMAQDKQANEKLVIGMGELERLNREIAQLGRMSHLLQACQSENEACAAVVQSGQILFPTEVAALYLMRSSRNYLEYKTGWGGTEAAEPLLTPESCWALRQGQAYRFERAHDGLPCAHVTTESPMGAYFCVPLIAQSETLGLLHIRFPARAGPPGAAATESRLQLATTFADQAALALANINLREVLKQQSLRDPLTGLNNRRFLEEALERELARAQRNKAPLALIMTDVDHFKRFNDTHGHEAGDAVLRKVAQTLRRNIRRSDMACRFGGEEFTVILPDSPLGAARERAELLREAVASLVLSHAGQTLGPVTMSFGVAVFPKDGGDSATLIEAADAALYRAKSEGRNRVEISRTEARVVSPGEVDGLLELESESA